jgi:hypothetical protein
MIRGGRGIKTFLPGGKTDDIASWEKDPVKAFKAEFYIVPDNLELKTANQLIDIYISWYSFYEKRGRIMDGYPSPSKFIGVSAI